MKSIIHIDLWQRAQPHLGGEAGGKLLSDIQTLDAELRDALELKGLDFRLAKRALRWRVREDDVCDGANICVAVEREMKVGGTATLQIYHDERPAIVRAEEVFLSGGHWNANTGIGWHSNPLDVIRGPEMLALLVEKLSVVPS